MSLTWTPAESATPTWTPASDDDLTFTTRGTLSSDAVTVGAETLTAYLADLPTGGVVVADWLLATDAVDGTATEFDVLTADQNGVAAGNVPALFRSVVNVPGNAATFQALLEASGFGTNQTVTVIVPGGANFGAYSFTPGTIGDPWTPVDGAFAFQVGAWFGVLTADAWVTASDAQYINYNGTGLLLGIEWVHNALHGIESLLDRWSFDCGMSLTANVNIAATNPTLEYGGCVAGGRVFLNAQTTPSQNGHYYVESDLTLTRLNHPDVFDPPGNGYRATLVAPADPAHGLTLMWLDDDRTHYFRGGAQTQQGTAGDPGEWVTVFDPTATGGGVALGETSTTAYRGDRGKTAYDHSQVTSGNPHGTTAADVGAAATSHSHTLANISDAGTLAGLNSVASANITDGTIVAADLAASLLGRIPTTVTVASDVPSPTDGTFTNTTGLAVPVVNGTTYYILGMLDVTGINAADLRVSLTCPTGEVRLSVQGKNYASTATTADTAYSSEILASGDIVTNLAVITGRSTLVPFQGRFTATADGTLQIQHSQRTANATATTVKAGSYLTYHT